LLWQIFKSFHVLAGNQYSKDFLNGSLKKLGQANVRNTMLRVIGDDVFVGWRKKFIASIPAAME